MLVLDLHSKLIISTRFFLLIVVSQQQQLLNSSMFFFSSFFCINYIILFQLQASKGPAQDIPSHPDTSETVYISSLALLKMLRHARSGVPMEVMGLMLGEFVDDYTINVVDVFAMPQSGTGVSVEDVDPVYEAKMLDVLKATNRSEMVVGWYHSHPGFGCWLSSVDVATQQSFEALAAIQSARGKVVIDAFRSIPNMGFGDAGKLAPTSEPRQTTSNLGMFSIFICDTIYLICF